MENKEYTLAEQFARTARLLLKQRMEEFREGGDVPDAWRKRLLGLIKARPGITEKELVKLLGHRMNAGEELLLGLERKGYVVLKPVEGKDGKTVELTELGLKEAAEAPDFGAAFDVLSAEEKAAMHSYLGRVAQELEKKAGSGDEGWGFDREHFMNLRGMLGAIGPEHMWKLHQAFRSGRDPRGGCGFWDMRGGF